MQDTYQSARSRQHRSSRRQAESIFFLLIVSMGHSLGHSLASPGAQADRARTQGQAPGRSSPRAGLRFFEPAGSQPSCASQKTLAGPVGAAIRDCQCSQGQSGQPGRAKSPGCSPRSPDAARSSRSSQPVRTTSLGWSPKTRAPAKLDRPRRAISFLI